MGSNRGDDRSERPGSRRLSSTRPRDRLGRPLAWGATSEVQEFDLEDPGRALAVAIDLWNQERFFEAHEVLEDVWNAAPDDDRLFWQGLIQVAVGCCHHQRGNVAGTVAILRKAATKLADYPDVHHGVDVEQLRVFAEGAAEAVEEAQEIFDIGYPEFPKVGAVQPDWPQH